ncbi:hypothetical protein [Streptomyces globisporus]
MTKTKISLDVDVQKGWGKQGHYTLSVGPISGRGRTLVEAKADLSHNILQALSAGSVDPAFARDDDGGIVVAIQGVVGGVTHWKVDNIRGPRPIAGCDGPPRESLQGCHHYEVLERA